MRAAPLDQPANDGCSLDHSRRRWLADHGGLALWFCVAPMNGAKASAPDSFAALTAAVDAGDLAVLRAALARGADLNGTGPHQRTLLHRAALTVHSALIDWLLANGARHGARDVEGRTPLHRSNVVSAQVLLRHGADIGAVDLQGNNPVHLAADGEGRRGLCRLLIDAGASINARNQSGLVPLHFAVLAGSRPLVEWLVEAGADLNAATRTDYAYRSSQIDPDVKGTDVIVPAGATPIAVARLRHQANRFHSGTTYTGIADFLLSKGALERRGWRPWH